MFMWYRMRSSNFLTQQQPFIESNSDSVGVSIPVTNYITNRIPHNPEPHRESHNDTNHAVAN